LCCARGCLSVLGLDNRGDTLRGVCGFTLCRSGLPLSLYRRSLGGLSTSA